tara:strand:- start:441 stop:926 length:486 start_codon:yes stop_codon:yes gene_type:complete
MTEIILHKRENVDYAIKQLNELDLSELHVVTIKPMEYSRSVAQNALMWQWITVISNETGTSKDDLHMQFKNTFLLPLLIRDGHEETVSMYQCIRTVWDAGMHDEAKTAKRNMLRHMISTTWLTVKQMTEYLREIEAYAVDAGIQLPHPDDYKWVMSEQRSR